METKHRIICGDALVSISKLEPKSVDCVVTSPPYYKLRDYGCEGQWGQEKTVDDYIDNLRSLLLELRRVVKENGTIWVNLADTYGAFNAKNRPRRTENTLLLIPQRFAIMALEAGFCVRNEIIWAKKNAKPESAKNRFARKFETVWFLTLQSDHYFDLPAVSQAAAAASVKRLSQTKRNAEKKRLEDLAQVVAQETDLTKLQKYEADLKFHTSIAKATGRDGGDYMVAEFDETKVNPGNVTDFWTIAASMNKTNHFAAFPEKLPTYCILAGCPYGGVVLDPFSGSGTTAAMAKALGRNSISIDLSPEYAELTKDSIDRTSDGMLIHV